MSTSFSISTKTYGAALDLTKQAIIVPAQAALHRETTLTSTWTRCRIALAIGFTNLVDDFGVPTTESCAAYSSQLLSWHVGLTNSATGRPGNSGVKFVGAGRTDNNSYLCRLHNNGSYWKLARDDWGSSMNFGRCATNGPIDAIKSGDDTCYWRATTPDGGVNFLTVIGFDITLLKDGGLTIYSNSNELNTSDPTSLALNRVLTGHYNTGGGSTSSGGWWDLSSTWSGCQHLFVRFPFLQNRLIIYGVQVMQLA